MVDKIASHSKQIFTKIIKNSFLFFLDWSWFEKSLLLINIIASSVFLILSFTISSFNPFSGGTFYGLKYSNTFQVILNVGSYIASISNIICLIFCSKKRIDNFIWGIIAVTLFGLLALANTHTGTAILSIAVQLPLNISGLYMWKKTVDSTKEVKPNNMSWQMRIFVAIIAISLTINAYFLFSWDEFRKGWYGDSYNTHNDFQHIIFDACAFIFAVIAQTMLMFRYKEQYILWQIVNVSFVILYAFDGNWQLVTTWTLAIINASYGIYRWFGLSFFKKKK